MTVCYLFAAVLCFIKVCDTIRFKLDGAVSISTSAQACTRSECTHECIGVARCLGVVLSPENMCVCAEHNDYSYRCIWLIVWLYFIIHFNFNCFSVIFFSFVALFLNMCLSVLNRLLKQLFCFSYETEVFRPHDLSYGTKVLLNTKLHGGKKGKTVCIWLVSVREVMSY